MVVASLTMSATPLVNLVQAIHLPSHRFLLTTSAAEASPHKVTLHLFAHTPSSDGNGGSSSDGSGSGYGADGNRLPSIIVWEGELDLKVKGVGASLCGSTAGGMVIKAEMQAGRAGRTGRCDKEGLPPRRYAIDQHDRA